MAVLSDADIKEYLKDGRISIEGFGESLLGTDSYDVSIGDIWEVNDDTLKDDILEIHHRLGSRGLNTEYCLPPISSKHLTLKRNRKLNPKKVYIAECTGKIETAAGIKARIVPRSGRARDGIHAFNPNVEGDKTLVAIVPYAFAQVPDNSIAQAVFYEKGTRPLSSGEMTEFYNGGKLFFSHADIRQDEKGNGYVPMSFDNKLRMYIGGELTESDSSPKFSKSRGRNSMFRFYLGITREAFGTGNSCVIWVLSMREGHLYPNAPLCHANVGEQKHTIEVCLAESDAEKITSNGRRQYHACSVRAYPLKSPTSRVYDGNYNRQREPLPKI